MLVLCGFLERTHILIFQLYAASHCFASSTDIKDVQGSKLSRLSVLT